jgi:hypothetical protein
MALSGGSSGVARRTQASTAHHLVVFGTETYLRLNPNSVRSAAGRGGFQGKPRLSWVAGARRSPTTLLLNVSVETGCFQDN